VGHSTTIRRCGGGGKWLRHYSRSLLVGFTLWGWYVSALPPATTLHPASASFPATTLGSPCAYTPAPTARAICHPATTLESPGAYTDSRSLQSIGIPATTLESPGAYTRNTSSGRRGGPATTLESPGAYTRPVSTRFKKCLQPPWSRRVPAPFPAQSLATSGHRHAGMFSNSGVSGCR
jgi:hypothetical protein